MTNKLPYDNKNPKSIEAYAKLLINKSLSDVINVNDLSIYKIKLKPGAKTKGNLGQAVETLYFQYLPNSDSRPDFEEAGVELKTNPILLKKKGFVAKERLVLNIINYNEEHNHTFRQSSFWKKNSLLLLMFYLYEPNTNYLKYIFRFIRLWEFPPNDLKILRDDWETIVGKIRKGKAHEISEGDTLYLGACTKGANKFSKRKQPFSNILAMQRAFSIKQRYLKFIIEDFIDGDAKYIDKNEYAIVLDEPINLISDKLERYRANKPKEFDPVVKSLKDYLPGETFEELIIRRFSKYLGKTEKELVKLFNIPKTSAKNRNYMIACRILGVKGSKIEEFEKADIQLKTVSLQHTGTLKESMSFPQIDFKQIISETWEESFWYETITKRFFFVVFRKTKDKNLVLEKVKFWTMPHRDLKMAKLFWSDTKTKIKNGDFSNFYKISDDKICHVRPKGKNKKDKMETIAGKLEKKKSYWLNASYIKHIVSSD